MKATFARPGSGLLFAGVFLSALVAFGQTPTLVQSNSAQGTNVSSLPVSFSSSNTAGNLIVASVRMATTTQTVTIADTVGNTYTSAVSQAQSTDGHQVFIFYAKNIKAGSNTVTASFSASNAHAWLAVYEYSGLGTTTALDATAHASGSSTAPSTGSTSTTTVANELVFGACGLPYNYAGTVTAGSGYTLLQQNTSTSRAANEGRSVTATGAYAGTFSLSATANWSAAVATFATAPAVTTSSLAAGTQNAAYSATLAAGGGKTSYTWSVTVGTLPNGLSLNSSSGAITGTPTATGTSNFTVQVKDANSNTGTKALSITINPPPSITTASLPAGTQNASYSATLAATGGTTPYTWSITVGTLPNGLSLNSSSGTITGTPTATGTSNITVQVKDTNSSTATKALSITINAPPSITTASLPAGTQNAAYSATLAATGGTTPYTWSITVGTLPNGLSLNSSSGAITGTPTATGTSNITVQVKDTNSSTATKALSITINAAVSITTASLPAGTQNASYSATLAATGGTTPYTWSVTVGTLPNGLSLNSSSGAITGTPTATGTSNITVQVKDTNNSTATKALSITINAPLSITTTSLPGGTLTDTYGATLAATGGATPYTWSVKAGTLPAGLSLTASSGAITGTPTTTGTSNITVQAKDANSNTATQPLSITIGGPDFSLDAIPMSLQVAQGGTATFTVTATPLDNFSQSIALSVNGLPAGATGSFSPTTLQGSGGATLNIPVSTGTAPGSYPLTVTGVSGSLSHQIGITLTVVAPAYYEAEAAANQLAGGAMVTACALCSGGYRVDNIGYNGPSSYGTLTFPSINAPTAGIYTLTVYYANGDVATRTANISVNGNTSSLSISATATGSWTTVNTVSVNVTLAAGSNTIAFSNGTAAAPAIDRISLVNTGSCSAASVDVVLVIDASSSMGGLPIESIQSASEAFVSDLQLTSDQIALVSFNSTATTNQTLTHTGSLVQSAIAALTSGGNTAIATGINAAVTELTSVRHNPAAQQVIVLLSDGNDSPASGATATTIAANAAKAAGIRLITIAYGAANAAMMQSWASSSSDYYASPTPDQMTAVYGSISASICRSPNQAPVVDAGPDQAVVLPAAATLLGTMSDDGLPQGSTLTATWTMFSGPGTVTFANSSAPATTATFSAAGTYVLQLSASDGQLTSAATVTVTVTVPVISVSIAPTAASLFGGQTQLFTATVTASSNQSVTWSVDVGTVDANGTYHAPTTITSQQTATVTAASQADPTKHATAAVTLLPPMGVSPGSVVLFAGNSETFVANQAVNWSISPTGVGIFNAATGNYTAPASIATEQILTVTGTSPLTPSQTASALIYLEPSVCTTSGYAYERTIVINHSQVPNTDQTSFPVLVSVTDPLLATTSYGGHVASTSGYDIIFTSDAGGANKLDHEIESYNPATGQIAMWVRIPVLSHTSDTTIYLLYGNSSVTTSQENKNGVWDSNYGGVWHLGGSGTALATADSTSHANNGTVIGSASEVPGQIGNGVALAGYRNYIDAGSNASVLPTHTGTLSVWVKYNLFSSWTTPIGNGNTYSDTNGALLWNDAYGDVYFEVNGPSSHSRTPNGTLAVGQWYFLTGAWDGSTVSLYVNGAPVGSAPQLNDASPAYHLTLGVDGALSSYGDFLNGILDEARVSSIARSADWVATEYNNQASPATFYSISAENLHAISISPAKVTLLQSQTQQLTAAVVGGCTSLNWTLSPTVGTIDGTGLYTAPSVISATQTITVSVAAQGSSGSAVATITLVPVSVSVSPTAVVLAKNQSQLFTATVNNAVNTAVTWSLSPAGAGAIDSTGEYTAPSSIATPLQVTVTATSQADQTQSASAIVTLITACATSTYSYQRALVIDHTKVPNTDQTNFPVLVSVTDPLLAAAANGGHVSSPNGYDIIFATDPAGVNKLDHEIEAYNPAIGQIIMWVRIPTLSHTADTVIYLLYGNASITASQENKAGVWDSNYMGVWHVENGSVLSLLDSTANGNNATNNGATATVGQIDGGMSTNGSTYATIGTPASLANLAQGNATFSAWVNTAAGAGGRLMGKDDSNGNQGWVLGINGSDLVDFVVVYGGSDLRLSSTVPVSNGSWSYVVVTLAGNSSQNGTATIYINGAPSGQGTGGNGGTADDSSQNAYLANATYGESGTLNGASDEFRISNVVRSSDWIVTEYANQVSPPTFYKLYPENADAVLIGPPTAALAASQVQQFAATVLGSCNSAVTWTSNPSGVGSLDGTGLYAAPAVVTSQQVVAITATSQSDTTKSASAIVTLMPPGSVSVSPAAVTLYAAQTQQFAATVVGSGPAVNWSISPAGLGAISSTGLYTAPSSVAAQQSVTVVATSQADGTSTGMAIVSLLPPPISVSVTPASASVAANQSLQFTASLTNTADQSVLWTLSPSGLGTIDSTGLYTAPASVSSQQQIIVTATSVADPTRSAAASLTLIAFTPSAFSPIRVNAGGPAYTDPQGRFWSASFGFSGVGQNGAAPYAFSFTPPAGTSVPVIYQTGMAGSFAPFQFQTSVPNMQYLVTLKFADNYYTSAGERVFDVTINGVDVLQGVDVVGSTGGRYLPWDATVPVNVTEGQITILFPSGGIINAIQIVPANSVEVLPSNPSLSAQQILQFSANVQGVTDQSVTWSLSPQVGTIDSTGLYTAPSSVAVSTQVTVTATSVSDPNLSGSTTLSLTPSQASAFSPIRVNAGGPAYTDPQGRFWSASFGFSGVGQNGAAPYAFSFTPPAGTSVPVIYQTGMAGNFAPFQFQTSVPNMQYLVTLKFADNYYTGAGERVFDVTINGVDVLQGVDVVGSTGGRYLPWDATVPVNVTDGLITILFPSGGIINAIEILPAGTVQLVPVSVNLWPSQQQQFSAEVADPANPIALWSLTPAGVGTITATGLYTAPAVIAAPQTVTLTAADATNPAWFSTATINLYPAAGIVVSPALVTMQGAQTQQFTATTASGAAVSWSLKPASVGTISATGLYTAPASVYAEQTITLVAAASDGSQATATIQLRPPAMVAVSPATATLRPSETQQFTATAPGDWNGAVVWTINPAGTGSITPGGLYAAPGTIAGPATVQITATSVANSDVVGTAIVTLQPASVSITVSPSSVSLSAYQTQQFQAAINGTPSTAVTWSITPSGAGTVSSAGLYTAPGDDTPQSVTVTATSTANSTQLASATIAIAPPASGYRYKRAIVIDHTKVPNTDQVNFPVLISGTYSYLANIANGGKVQNPNGYDIVFTADCTGDQKLDHEIESYSATSGTISMWVRVPYVSHTTDTVFYMSYGDSSITTSQENKSGVWDGNYQMVLHLSETAAPYRDSTLNAYTSTGGVAPAPVSGKIGGAQSFDGVTQYIAYSQAQSPNPNGAISMEAWIKTTGTAAKGVFGKWLNDGRLNSDESYLMFYKAGGLPGGLVNMAGSAGPEVDATATVNDGNWHHLAVTAAPGGMAYVYVDGEPRGSIGNPGAQLTTTADRLLIGATNLATGGDFMNGVVNEVRISNSARSGDWIAAEFNSQSSPSTFYTVYPENATVMLPAATTLSSSQSQQLTAVFAANPNVSPLTLLGGVQTPSAAESVGVQGNLAYVCDSNEVSIVDVSNPSQPVLVGTAGADTLANDGFGYCAIQRGALVGFVDAVNTGIGNSPSFVAFNLSSPAQPQLIKSSPMTRRFFSNTPEYVGNIALVPTFAFNFVALGWVDQHGDVVAVDVSDFTNPSILSTLSSGGDATYGGPNPVFGVTAANGQTALAGSTTSTVTTNGVGKLVAIDISNPAALSEVTEVQVPGTVDLYKPAIDGSVAVAGGDDGGFCGSWSCTASAFLGSAFPGHFYITTFDIADPRNPAILASIQTPYMTGPNDGATVAPVRIADHLILFGGVEDAQSNPLLLLADISDPRNPNVRAFPVPVPITQMVVSGGVLYASAGAGGLAIFQIPGLTTGQYTPASCSAPATWTLNPPGLGTITADGVYTAPSGITSTQTVTVTATNPADPTQTVSSTITLWPGLLTTLAAVTPGPYTAETPATFQATVTNIGGTPQAGVSLTFSVTGANVRSATAVTDANGQASFTYTGTTPGNDVIEATASSGGMTVRSSPLGVQWVTASGGSAGSPPTVVVSANTSVTLPNPLALSATVTDPAAPLGGPIGVLWSEVSGPAPVTFADPTQAATSAVFTQPGTYLLQVVATDLFGSTTVQLTPAITVNQQPAVTQGWIGSPADGSTVTGLVPITLATGVTLSSGTLTYSPASDITQVSTLNATATGTGQIGTLDTTLLANGGYWIQLIGYDSNGNRQNNLTFVNVVGNYKPGRVTATVTDLTVPAKGLAIQIQRSYDSLNAGQSSDFGYGWSLGTKVALQVDPKNNVTFTLGGQRRTFYFAPQTVFPSFIAELPLYLPAFTPEPGLPGTLAPSGHGCTLGGYYFWDVIVQYGNLYMCDTGGQYSPPGYIYTDQFGTQYTMGSDGSLQSIVDRGGNTLTVTASGISSSTGLSVPFVRDSQGRITQITDTKGNQYVYSYDANGNLATVTYPPPVANAASPQTSYTYYTSLAHLYQSGTDARGNPLPTAVYDTNGRLISATDALNQTTSYSYDLVNNITTTTFPDTGVQTVQYDSYGMVLSTTDPLQHTTINTYDSSHNLASTTDPLGHTWTYTNDANGNQLSKTYPKTATSVSTTSYTVYNQYSEPTGTKDELGNVTAYAYDANFNPQFIIDNLNGTPTVKASFAFNPDGTMQAGAIGYDITQTPGMATTYTYDAYGNMLSKTDALGRTTAVDLRLARPQADAGRSHLGGHQFLL